MSGAAAQQPDIGPGGMPIDNEVRVRTVFVLAHASLNQGSIRHSGEAEGHVLANRLEQLPSDHPLSPGWIKNRTTGVIGNFETPSQVSRNSIVKASSMVRPNRQLGFIVSAVPPGRSKEKHVLFRNRNTIS